MRLARAPPVQALIRGALLIDSFLQKVLTEQLREPVSDGIVQRQLIVEYICLWGREHIEHLASQRQ